MKNKVLLFLVPLLVFVFGWILYYDGKSHEPRNAHEVNEKVFIEPGDRTVYESKMDMKKKLETSTYKEQLKKARTSNPRQFFTDVLKKSEPETLPDPQEPVEEKQKVKVVYVDRPAKVKEKPNPSPRRRVGFNTDGRVPEESGSPVEGHQIMAVIHRDIQVGSSEVVKLRTLEASEINGVLIPKNTLVDGVVSLGSNRIYITVKGIRIDEQYMDQSLEAYSLQGVRGLEVNLDMAKDTGKKIIADAISSGSGALKMPIDIHRSVGHLGQEKVKDPAIKLQSGTKVYLR